MTVEFDAPLWRWAARTTDLWTFVSLPTGIADDILDRVGEAARGFGSVRVDVAVGGTAWRTSIFPADETYVLPVKKAVRKAEGLDVGDTVHVELSLVDF